jgi:hypothetical protein
VAHARVVSGIREERHQTVWETGTKKAFRDRPGQGERKEKQEEEEIRREGCVCVCVCVD